MFEDPEIRIHKLQPCTQCPRLEDLWFSWYFRYIHDRCLRSSACHQDIHGASLYAPLALKQTYEVYFGYDCTLRKYGRFRQKLPVKTDFRKNSARRRPVTGRSPRTGEEAQYICSYSEQVRPEAFIIGSVCCFSGMIYPHIQRPDPVNRSMNDQQRIH